MCGILGGNAEEWRYEEALNIISHRGPDCQKIQHDANFVLAFARLSIRDLSDAGMQPMTTSDGSVTIVYNGEIYGYEELERKLEKKYRFRSKSDTEVILYAYLEYGNRFIDYIDGIFAIAVLDRKSQTICLYRDRAGVKPLYYYYDGKKFAFASELKAIKKLVDRKLHRDNTAIYDYLSYLYVPAPKTMYKEVRQLKPAHTVVFDLKKCKLSRQMRYWRLDVSAAVGKSDILGKKAVQFRELFHEVVKEQMVADVPVGSFLSGGVDSSIVTFEAIQQNKMLESFSIGFDERKYDESKYYYEFVKKFNNTYNEKKFDREIFNSLYTKLKEWYDEPFADTSAFPTYLVSKLAKEKVTVALTGDGADELFGGYGWFNLDYPKAVLEDSKKLTRIYECVCASHPVLYSANMRKYLSETLSKYCLGHGYGTRNVKEIVRKELKIPKDYDDYWFLRRYDKKELPPVTRWQYLDFHTYLPEILTKVDRASMQVSLETRVPFLSRKVIEFAFSMTQEERCPGGEMKHILRCAYPEIPKNILYKRKQGFCMPRRYMGKVDLPMRKILKEIWNI